MSFILIGDSLFLDDANEFWMLEEALFLNFKSKLSSFISWLTQSESLRQYLLRWCAG
jgi:hypothetical protein